MKIANCKLQNGNCARGLIVIWEIEGANPQDLKDQILNPKKSGMAANERKTDR